MRVDGSGVGPFAVYRTRVPRGIAPNVGPEAADVVREVVHPCVLV
jgi:hypothetical protein